MPQGIEKVLEKLRSIRLSDGHFDSTGEYDDELLEHIIRSAIETAFKEVRPRPRMPVGDVVYGDGYLQAVKEYDKAVDKFLGK